MITRLYYIFMTMMLVVMTCACSNDSDADVAEVVPGEDDARPMTAIEATVSLGGSAATRVSAVPGTVDGTDGLCLSWDANERLGVYIKKTDNTIARAGYLTSVGEAGVGARKFTGAALALKTGEQYLYMHPDLGNAETINYTQQSGELSSTAHLSNLVPLIWTGPKYTDGAVESYNAGKPTHQGYVVHVKMQFKNNPETIRSIKMCTMKRGSEDRIFPKAFDVSRMASDVNNTVESGTQGTGLSDDDYTDNITLTVEGTATEVVTGAERHWEADAYMACASVKNLNVFNTKYHVTADCDGGLFTCSDFLSFPGQETSTSRTLDMLSDGKVYNLNVKLSKDVCNTIISSSYSISSILGMWNSNGVVYDPARLIVKNSADLPSQLQNNRTSIIKRYKEVAKSGTKLNYSDLYKTNNPDNGTTDGDWKQENVTFNNISIVEPTEVFFTYLHNDGDQGDGKPYGSYRNKNLVGYYYYNTPSDGESAPPSPNLVQKNIIYPNTTVIEEFETVRLLYTDDNGFVSTTFPAGVTIGFYLMINPTATDADHSADFSLMRWTQWTGYSNSVWNKSNTGWPMAGYTRNNFFATGDVSSSANKDGIIPGLAFYAVKDRGNDVNASWCHSALLYMVSTSNPAAMKTYNKGFINIGTGTLINNK